MLLNYFVAIDWLLDRRHCNLKWQSAVKGIREKINAAIQDMPENEEIKQLLSGSCRSFIAQSYLLLLSSKSSILRKYFHMFEYFTGNIKGRTYQIDKNMS